MGQTQWINGLLFVHEAINCAGDVCVFGVFMGTAEPKIYILAAIRFPIFQFWFGFFEMARRDVASNFRHQFDITSSF